MELIDLPDFGPDDYHQIVGDEPDPFGTEQLGISWKDKSDHLGLMDQGQLIAHAGWVAVDIRPVSGASFEVLGLGGVIVHRDRRGAGVGRQLVTGAMTRMREGSVSAGMLFCRTERLSFYQRLGWLAIEAEVTVEQPGGVIIMPLRTCWLPLAEEAEMPPGDLRVAGLPF
jgi:predicted N-acetyltransferase YhbS